MFDFFNNNASEIISIAVSILATLVPIPFIVKDILKNFRKMNETTICNQNLHEIGSNIAFSDMEKKFVSVLHCPKKQEENEKENDSESTSSSPKSHNYNFYITYLSKKTSLNELYEKRNTDKFLKKVSFTLAVVMSVIGTIILFVGILMSLFAEKEVGWITTSSGGIIELVAGIYFWLVNRTMKEVKDNSKQLEKTEDLLTAIELAEKISDPKIKDETYQNMIEQLLSKK